MDLGYMQLNVKTVGLGSGLIMSQLGNSHYGIEDVAMMRSIPGMTVINPADGLELVKAVESLCEYNKPAYLRLTGGPNLPIVYEDNYEYKIGKSIVLSEGEDICIISSGTMVYNSLKAAEILKSQGLSASVVDFHTIKPIDQECLDRLTSKKIIVTVEEASVVGGLGSAVAEYFAGKKERPPHLLLGIKDTFLHAGSYEYLLKQCRLTAEMIAEDIMSFYKRFA